MLLGLIVKSDVIADMIVQHVTREDESNPDIKQQIDEFNRALLKRIDDTTFRMPIMTLFFIENKMDNLHQWDHAYGNNTPEDSAYGTMVEDVLPEDAEDPPRARGI